MKTDPALWLFRPLHHLVQNFLNGPDVIAVQLHGFGEPAKLLDQLARRAHQAAELARISHEQGRIGDSVYHRNPTRKRGLDVTAGSTGRELRTILAYASGYDGGVVRNAG